MRSKVPFQELTHGDRRDALRAAEYKCGRRAQILEKDIWVVASIRALFNANFASHLTFKGGTSLSKVWQTIRRFSEDVDITYDIRAFAPDLVSGVGDEAIPPSRSQEKRWSRTIRKRLSEWVRDIGLPAVDKGLLEAGMDAEVIAENDRVCVKYNPLFEESGFLRPTVFIEFGARSTGEPQEVQPIICDVATHLPELSFPRANPRTMRPERTFWEKATAIHVYCNQEKPRGNRLSRHWYDLARLDEAGIASRALSDRKLGYLVARHKQSFFSEKDAKGRRIDYRSAIAGKLKLVPSGVARSVLAADFENMLEVGMLFDESETFESLMQRCGEIEATANLTHENDA